MRFSNTIDDTVFQALRFKTGRTPDLVIDVASGITRLGDGMVLAGISVVVTLYFLATKKYRLALITVITIGAAFLISAGLKTLIQRARPDEYFRLYHTTSPSFPSGHALRSTTVYLFLAALMSINGSDKGNYYAVGLLLALCIGMSRILLGVHWPSDVIAGWLIGFVIFYAALKAVARYGYDESLTTDGDIND